MHTTPVSLLQRLRRPGEAQDWERFVALYTPFLLYWARRLGAGPEERADLVQDVLTVMVQKLPDFAYDKGKSFRGWLRTITINRWRDRLRRPALQQGCRKPSCPPWPATTSWRQAGTRSIAGTSRRGRWS